jgi:hypothetical protein
LIRQVGIISLKNVVQILPIETAIEKVYPLFFKAFTDTVPNVRILAVRSLIQVYQKSDGSAAILK